MPARAQFFVNSGDPEDVRSNHHRSLFLRCLRNYEDEVKVSKSLSEEVSPLRGHAPIDVTAFLKDFLDQELLLHPPFF